MKIDMSREAVTLRLAQVANLRCACLALAKSNKSTEIRRRRSSKAVRQGGSKAVRRRRFGVGPRKAIELKQLFMIFGPVFGLRTAISAMKLKLMG